MMIASRAQADQYARAGLDWARGVLLQDLQTAGGVDSLDEGWAQPMVGLPVERAIVSGNISDEQGQFNLNNLVNAAGQKSDADFAVFQRLLAALEIQPELAEAVLDWIDADGDLAGGAGAEDAYYLALARPYRAANAPLAQVEELYRIRGFDAATVAKLRPFVTAIDRGARVNVNTASAQVLAAVFGPAVSAERIAQLVAQRKVKAFRSTSDVSAIVGSAGNDGLAMMDVKSAFFRVQVLVTQDDVELVSEALIKRNGADGGAAGVVIAWRRDRS
jgi:general secretion pathway protein K